MPLTEKEKQESLEDSQEKKQDTTQTSQDQTDQVTDEQKAALAHKKEQDEKDAILAAQFKKIRALEEGQNKLRAEIDESKKGPPPSKDQLTEEFWKDPVSVMRKQMEEIVAPIRDHVFTSKSESDYDKLKKSFKTRHPNPKIKQAMIDYEDYIDGLMTRFKNPTEDNLQAIIYGVIGAVATGEIEVRGRANDGGNDGGNDNRDDDRITEEQRRSVVDQLPAHLRPSPVRAPANRKPERKYRELTELEKRLARENNMTPEQYIEALELPADMVADTDFSKLGSSEDKK